MNNPLRNIFKLQIKTLTGFDFQDFVVDLFLLKYGEQGFTVIRKKKDKGCDGIINGEKRVIACYGPEDATQKKFEDKADDDFKDYQNNWGKKYPKWMFIVNQDISPAQINKIESLKSGTPLLGTQQILSIIEGLKNDQRRKLAKYLKIEDEFISSDYLGEIFEDLLKGSETALDNIKYDTKGRINTEEKIAINYDKSDIEEAINEYGLLMESGSLKKVSDLLFGYEDEEIDRMKHRILYDYSNLTIGSFKTRLKQLTEHYLVKYSSENDDDYLHYIRTVLIYLFEQCLIGRKIKQENDIAASRK
ncbi:MAG: hypothetical protein CVT88_02540 [Candidatus Altiarchaeales archaeon HGW-Altiarchaeales-1]|nr:MAG: hypothetical protein CVT88_02540 [Candidatus Altiarchaeales archaeon HGW-Altiarchaeales-1]